MVDNTTKTAHNTATSSLAITAPIVQDTGNRYVVGFPMLTGLCNHHSLDHMHGELSNWLKENPNLSWLIVRRGQLTAHDGEVDYSAKVVQRGGVIGTYMGREIVDFFICADDTLYQYIGIISDMRQISRLAIGMRVMAPGLLYQEAPRAGVNTNPGCFSTGFINPMTRA